MVASSAQVDYYVWDTDRAEPVGPYTKSDLVDMDPPAGTQVCTSDGKDGFHDWMDVSAFIAPGGAHQQPREEAAYNSSHDLTREQSAALAGRLRQQSSVNEKARAAAQRSVGGGAA